MRINILFLFILLFFVCWSSSSYILKRNCLVSQDPFVIAYNENSCISNVHNMYVTCIDGLPYSTTCSDFENDPMTPLDYICVGDQDYYECVENLDDYPNTHYLYKHVYAIGDEDIYRLEIIKLNECYDNHMYLFLDSLYISQYTEVCSNFQSVFKFEIDTFYMDGEEMIKYKYEYNTSQTKMLNYVLNNGGVTDPEIRKYHRTNTCYDSTKFFAFEDGTSFGVGYSDTDCTSPQNIFNLDDFGYFEGVDHLIYGKDLCYLYYYDDYDECMEDITDTPPTIEVLNCDNRLCIGGLHSVLHDMSYNNTHYNVTVSRMINSIDCDDFYDLADPIKHEYPYNECFMVNYPDNEDLAFPFKLGKNKLIYFDNVTCDIKSCTSNSIVNLTENIIVDFNLTISDSSFIYIPIGGDQNTIIVKDDGSINLEGGTVVIQINTDDDLNYLFQQIDKDGSYKYTIIKGKYNGDFDDISLDISPNVNNDRCETIESNFQKDNNELSVIFRLDNSKCSLKWWIILLICIGIIVVLATIFIIIVITNKTVRNKVLPFRNRKQKSSAKEEELYENSKNNLYQGKTKVNPAYE